MDGMQERTWWNRNWKWLVPLAGLCALALLAGVVTYVLFGLVKSTDVYKEAMARAKAHPAVMQALGSPIKEGFLVRGTWPQHSACCPDLPNGVTTKRSVSLPLKISDKPEIPLEKYSTCRISALKKESGRSRLPQIYLKLLWEQRPPMK